MKRSTTVTMLTFAATAVLLAVTPRLSQAQQMNIPGLGNMILGGMGITANSQTAVAPQVSFLIVDGVRVSATKDKPNPLDQVDPSKIVTIEVQKGPSAVKLYGPDVVNGVIVITTKKDTVSH